MNRPPQIVVIAGPNGAGKSTAAPVLLRDALRVHDFVNADVIAQGLSGYAPNAAAFAAGRIMLARLQELAAEQADFAFETTMAARSYAPWLRDLQNGGYQLRIFFLWLPNAEFAVNRVRQRVRAGGHHVDHEAVIRRYRAGLRNFVNLYRPIADDWRVYNNSAGPSPTLIAAGRRKEAIQINDAETWQAVLTEFDHA
jgi:predicted ABC-type ATPase